MLMEKNARLFHCSLCHCQAVVCSHCDRGNIYCSHACSRQAHVKYHRAANQIYQKSFKGRRKHAARQQRYRQRQKNKVTDQGSSVPASNDVLIREFSEQETQNKAVIHCYFCGKKVSLFVRYRFLRNDREELRSRFPACPLGP